VEFYKSYNANIIQKDNAYTNKAHIKTMLIHFCAVYGNGVHVNNTI